MAPATDWEALAEKLDGLVEKGEAKWAANFNVRWAKAEAKICRARLAYGNGAASREMLNEAVKTTRLLIERRRVSERVYLRVVQLCYDLASCEGVNWYLATAGVVYTHARMGTGGASAEAQAAAQAAIWLQEADALLRSKKKNPEKVREKLTAVQEVLSHHIKGEDPGLDVVMRHNDLVDIAAGAGFDDLGIQHHLAKVEAGGVACSVPLSRTWRTMGLLVWQAERDGKPVREVRLQPRPKGSAKRAARAPCSRRTRSG